MSIARAVLQHHNVLLDLFNARDGNISCQCSTGEEINFMICVNINFIFVETVRFVMHLYLFIICICCLYMYHI